MELTEFLLARIAEDEEVLTRPEQVRHQSHLSDAVGTFSPRCPTCRQLVWGSRERGLAECDAKRRIVDEMAEALAYEQLESWERVLQLLALPYAEHPDYQEAWRP